jgi:ATP-dependent NAD(P)H-hydrate dehydratase
MEKSRLRVLLGHFLPELHSAQYKGNSGKVVVIGGSVEYTGAPFYAAVSALRSGSDLSHIFCPSEAMTPIKCYSPEIIVHNSASIL